jgi:hypothetical protein
VKLEKAMELAELGFYKKKNGFEGAQDVLDFYNETFKKISLMETEVILPRWYILRRWNLLLWQRLLIPKRQKKAPLLL